MAKRVNSISLRLGKRLTWNHVWSVNRVSSATKILTGFNTHRLTSTLLESSSNINNLSQISTNSFSRIYLDILTSSNYTSAFDSIASISKSIPLGQNAIRDINNKLRHLSVDSHYSYSTNFDAKTLQRNKGLNSLPALSAQVLAKYITNQIVINDSLKSQSFKSDLSNGIAKTSISILKMFQLNDSTLLSGLKVECYGKWKQTNTGRKQSVKFIVGKVHTQQLSQLLSYGTSSISTRFGICTVRVWLCFKSY